MLSGIPAKEREGISWFLNENVSGRLNDVSLCKDADDVMLFQRTRDGLCKSHLQIFCLDSSVISSALLALIEVATPRK